MDAADGQLGRLPAQRLLHQQPVSARRDAGRVGGGRHRYERRPQVDAGIFSTKSARQAGASKGFAKYSVIRATRPSRISPIPT